MCQKNMFIVLDINTLIRLFVNEEPAKAQKAQELLESQQKLDIPDVVFSEIEYVPMNACNSPWERVIKVFSILLAQKNIKV